MAVIYSVSQYYWLQVGFDDPYDNEELVQKLPYSDKYSYTCIVEGLERCVASNQESICYEYSFPTPNESNVTLVIRSLKSFFLHCDVYFVDGI